MDKFVIRGGSPASKAGSSKAPRKDVNSPASKAVKRPLDTESETPKKKTEFIIMIMTEKRAREFQQKWQSFVL